MSLPQGSLLGDSVIASGYPIADKIYLVDDFSFSLSQLLSPVFNYMPSGEDESRERARIRLVYPGVPSLLGQILIYYLSIHRARSLFTSLPAGFISLSRSDHRLRFTSFNLCTRSILASCSLSRRRVTVIVEILTTFTREEISFCSTGCFHLFMSLMWLGEYMGALLKNTFPQ